jgi:RNA polymerase sigma-70 factor (ECF subfamily)
MGDNLDLVCRAKRGDTDAFAELYSYLYGDLYRFAIYTLKNTADAEDAVSETVTDAYVSIGKLRDEQAFRGWIFRILTNKCRDRLRERAKKICELDEAVAVEIQGSSADENVAVRQSFFELNEDERIIIAMHVFGGYKSREIAAILGMNENTVRSKESRGLKKMEKRLG